MKGLLAIAWVICLTCTLPGALLFKSKDRPDQVVEISTDNIECFSDYMALWIPRSRVQGLKQWLSRTLQVPVNWAMSMGWLNSFLTRCGYFLHPDSAGNYIFQALYTACFVRQEKANYLLEIRIFQKGIKSFGQSDHYILKCPVINSNLGQESILCGPETIQVSRPIPQGNANRQCSKGLSYGDRVEEFQDQFWKQEDLGYGSNKGRRLSNVFLRPAYLDKYCLRDSGLFNISVSQSPWLLSLRGELVALLEDASLLGLYVETNGTTITIMGPRQQLLQRKEVMNTSVDFLPLWMVNGYYAYSLEAMCPLVSSQPGPEVLVQIPKQGLGLVKRGSRNMEALTLRDLRVSQSNSFTITENRDFVMVSIPARDVLQSQQCQEAQGVPRMQSFYRIDLSVEFAEVASPVQWTVENFFHCSALKEQPSSHGMMDPKSFLAEVSPSVSNHLRAHDVPYIEESKSDLPPPLTTLNLMPSHQPSSPALPPSTPSVSMQSTSLTSLQSVGSTSSEDLHRESFGNFVLDNGQREQAVGTSPAPCLQLKSSSEEYLASARTRSPFHLGCLTPNDPTVPSTSTSPTPRASTFASVLFQEINGSPKNLQSNGATFTVPLPGLWLHSLALNPDKKRPLEIPVTLLQNGGSPKSEKPPEATEKMPKAVSKTIMPEPSDSDLLDQDLPQMSTTLTTDQNDSPKRHPGSQETNALFSKNLSDGIIHPLLSLTTPSPKKEQQLIMKSQAMSVGMGGDSIIASVPGAMMKQQIPKDPINEGPVQVPPSLIFQYDPTPPSVTTDANSQVLQSTLPAPTNSGPSVGQLLGPATYLTVPQLVSFRSTKYLGSLMHLQKSIITQTDSLREIRPGQDLTQLPEHSNQLRKLMESSGTETDRNPQRQSVWVTAGLQGGNHLTDKDLATTVAGRKADNRYGHNQRLEATGLQGAFFPTSEITVMTQRDPHLLQNRTEGILVTNLPLSGSEGENWSILQAEPQRNSPLSWRDVSHTNRGRILSTSFPEEIISDSSITHQEWPKTDGPTSPTGHVLRSPRAFGQTAIHPSLLPRLLPEKQLSDAQKRALDGIIGSTLASTLTSVSRNSEVIRTQGLESMPTGKGWDITQTSSSWSSWMLHPESYLSQATEAASPSISNPMEPGDPFPTGH